MNDGIYQATSAPYSADNLKVHDKDLVWTREFGTETTDATGQAFNTTDSGTAPVNTINARMGMLQVDVSGADVDSMSGTTFLIPPWATYADSPLIDPDKAIILFAHFLLADSNTDDSTQTQALLVLAAEDFVGNVDSEDCSAIAIVGNEMEPGQEAQVQVQAYEDGAGTEPSSSNDVDNWGTNIYVRLLITGDVGETKESDMSVWISRDGISWTFIGESQLTAEGTFRRIGLGVTGASGTARLDWMRIYNYPIAGITNGVLSPPMPLTGGRRFS